MTTVKILWVDDDKKTHLEDAKNMKHKNKKLDIELIQPQELTDRLKKFKDDKQAPDLFLVDFFLNMVKDKNGKKYPHRGLVAANEIREGYPEHPIYCVSLIGDKKIYKFAEYAHAREQVFDEYLTFKDLQRVGHKILYHDALDYRLIKGVEPKNVKELFKLLKAPEEEQDILKKVLPEELKEGLRSERAMIHAEGNAIAFARWAKRLLFGTPGLIYNKFYTATYLGVKEEYFDKISSRFNGAEYKGIFYQTAEPMWWVSNLNKKLFSYANARKMSTTNPWEIAPAIFEVPKNKQTRCAVCNEEFPEIVGINLEDGPDLQPVHYKCSISHPDKKREMYFDEVRGFEYPSE